MTGLDVCQGNRGQRRPSWIGIFVRGENGHSLHWTRGRFRGPEHRARARLRQIDEEAAMNWVYVLSGVLAAGIFIYLVIALLWPEKF
jgi:K+-transporting ATPase KdpF subunit